MTKIFWFVLQGAIVIGVVIFNEEYSDQRVQPAAAILVGVGLAFTVTLFWTLLKDLASRLFRRKRRSIVRR